MKKYLLMISCLLAGLGASAETYLGRVVDATGQAIPFANIYLKQYPTEGTVSNSLGSFTLSTEHGGNSTLVVSFIGYQTKEFPIRKLSTTDTMRVEMKEEPIELEKAVVEAKRGRKRNREKGVQKVLYLTYNQLEAEFPTTNTKYAVSTDVRAYSQGKPCVIEKMTGNFVDIPSTAGSSARDTFQFVGSSCTRYMDPITRGRIDKVTGIVTDKKELGRIDRMDHGSRVQEGLWKGSIRQEFAGLAKTTKGWTISKENDEQTVLTHTHTKNILGIYKVTEVHNYIVNSTTYSMLRASSEMQVSIHIPIGYKMKGELLGWVNVLNMNNDEYEKFRMKSAVGTIKQNVIFEHENGHIYVKEKNLRAVGTIKGDNGKTIPVNGSGTIHVLSKQTKGVKPYPESMLEKHVKRTFVDIE